MAQGKSRSVNTLDLSFIFFKIRETRCSKTRRSWQRRARLALAQREDLTAAERHEICSVWSRSNVAQIDSPAMSKLQGKEHRPQPNQTVSARSCTRRRFDAPSAHRCSAARTNHALENGLHHPESCTLRRELSLPLKLHFQGYIYQRLRRGSDEPVLLNDSRLHQRRRRGREPERCKPQKTRIARLISNSRLNLSKKHFLAAHEMSCK